MVSSGMGLWGACFAHPTKATAAYTLVSDFRFILFDDLPLQYQVLRSWDQ